MRIVDICPSIELLFLENSHAIVKRGLDGVLRALKKRGFKALWCITNALDVGALHRRKRWYCICYRGNGIKLLKETPHDNMFFNWNKDKGSRIIQKPVRKADKEYIVSRCKMLGNSIVPQCAAYVWNKFVKHLQSDPLGSRLSHSIDIGKLRVSPPLNLEMDDGKNIFKKSYWATPLNA